MQTVFFESAIRSFSVIRTDKDTITWSLFNENGDIILTLPVGWNKKHRDLNCIVKKDHVFPFALHVCQNHKHVLNDFYLFDFHTNF